MSTTSPPIAPPKSGGRLLLWTGILAAVVGVVIYTFQLGAGKLTTPWYAPALATFGLVLVLASLFQRRTAWRVVALLLVGFITAGEWWFLSYSKLPSQPGRIAKGEQLPEFTAYRSDGPPFTQDDLKGDQNTALVFFRGHW
jgi:hypothetical protein